MEEGKRGTVEGNPDFKGKSKEIKQRFFFSFNKTQGFF